MTVRDLLRRNAGSNVLPTLFRRLYSSALDRLAPLCLFSLGAALVTSALLKAMALREGTVAAVLAPFPRSVQEILIVGEFLMGSWWASGVWPRMAYRVAIVVFLFFAGIQGWLLAHGSLDCGCTGSIHIPPAVMLAFDGAVAATLLWHRPVFPSTRESMPFGAIILRVTGISMVAFGISFLAHERPVGGNPRVAIGEPISSVVGRDLDELGISAPGKKFHRGHWCLVMWSATCGKCRDELPRIVELSRSALASPDSPRVGLIVVPPSSDGRPCRCETLLVGKLAADAAWLRLTPYWLRVKDGVVIAQGPSYVDVQPPGCGSVAWNIRGQVVNPQPVMCDYVDNLEPTTCTVNPSS